MAATIFDELAATGAPRVVSITVDQFHQMIDVGILPEGAPIELIDGVLVHKDRADADDDPVGHGKRHAQVVSWLVRLDSQLVELPYHLLVQLPVTLSGRSEPEPDIAIARSSPADYSQRHPGPTDVLLVIEVALRSLAYDRTTKLRLYAAAGIPEYWVANGRDDRLEIHTEPIAGEARYARRRELSPGDVARLELGGGSALVVDVAELFRR